MALKFFTWSRTAATNATADSAVNWSEGQAPSSVNDSARSMMASAAGFRDDHGGSTATGGTSTAYTLSTFQVYDQLGNGGAAGQIVAFNVHTACGSTVTLNVDSLGAKPLRIGTGSELFAGMLVPKVVYTATYHLVDQVWYLHGFYNLPPTVVAVSGLPSASAFKGFRFMVNDATATTFWSVVAGSGANTVPVASDGTNWRIG